MVPSEHTPARAEKKQDLSVFLILTVVLAPVLSVAIVGGLGFSIWIYQVFTGPPGS